jgi:hypothetical protein
MTNSRAKGAVGEREALRHVREWGLVAERVDSRAASAGNATGVDLLFGTAAPKWPLEVKRGRRYGAPAWAKPYLARGIPVITREDRADWILLLPERLIGPALRAVAAELERLAGEAEG